jgi:O-acetyl-ADP-ribose deacetylase (regulator of RNase III)
VSVLRVGRSVRKANSEGYGENGRNHRFARMQAPSYPGDVQLEVVPGDITAERVDAIVNAANEQLARGGGVCGAIFAAAGPELDAACRALGGCPTGEAKATSGFALRARWIIHAVGPVWQGGGAGEPQLLASAYRRTLAVADEIGARSVAFPAISTGIYGYPLDAATDVAVATVRDATTDVELVRFVCFDDRTRAAYAARL